MATLTLPFLKVISGTNGYVWVIGALGSINHSTCAPKPSYQGDDFECANHEGDSAQPFLDQ